MSTSAQAVYALISAASTQGVEEFVLLFAYEGFNPEMVHAHFAKIMQEKGISEAELTNDLRGLITLGAMKGNYTLRNAGKISDAGRKAADALYAKYNLKMGAIAGDKKAITLPRVLSAFPELTTKVIRNTPDRNFGTRTSKLPRIIKNPVFPTLIPKTMDSNAAQTLLWIYAVYSADQSLVISQEKDFNNAFAVQKQFITIAFNSSVPHEETRKKIIRTVTAELVQALVDMSTIDVPKTGFTAVTPDQLKAVLDTI